jgi:ABC-type polysaccharide/polyol phosphate transport system ATPase subunit
MTDIALSCSGVTKSFVQYVHPSAMLQDRVLRWKQHRKRWELKVLDDISLEVKKGEWVGVYGPNGTGKTTLLRILAGLLPPDAGSVERSGLISCFFELGVGFHPERSAAENLYLHGLLHGIHPSIIRAKTDEVIRFAGVESHRDLPTKCYSTGMNARLGYAAAAIVDADTYIFDEVFAVADAAFQAQCREHMYSLKVAGKSALVVSHNLKDLERFCDRILFMEKGKIIEDRKAFSFASRAGAARPAPAFA